MGRSYKFKNAEDIWIIYQNYLKHLAENPMFRNELIKSGERAGEQIAVKVDVPPNIYGFCLFCEIERKTFYNYINAKESDILDAKIIRNFMRVNDDIKQRQLTGATVNLYNSSIVARMTGLSDKVEVTNYGEKQFINININGENMDLTR